MENSSQEFYKEKISEMVQHQQDKYSWEFIFMGANIDSFGEGGSMGFAVNTTMNYDANSRGTTALYAAVSSGILKKRADVSYPLNMADEYNEAYEASE